MTNNKHYYQKLQPDHQEKHIFTTTLNIVKEKLRVITQNTPLLLKK